MTECIIINAPGLIESPAQGSPIIDPAFHPDQLGIPYFTLDFEHCFQDEAGTTPCAQGSAIRRINSRGVMGMDLIVPEESGFVASLQSASGVVIAYNPVAADPVFGISAPLMDFVASKPRLSLAVQYSSNAANTMTTVLGFSNPDDSERLSLGPLSTETDLLALARHTSAGAAAVEFPTDASVLRPAGEFCFHQVEVDFSEKFHRMTVDGETIWQGRYAATDDDNTSSPVPAKNLRLWGYLALMGISGFAVADRLMTQQERRNLSAWFAARGSEAG